MRINYLINVFLWGMFLCLFSSQVFGLMIGLSTEELTKSSEVVIKGEVGEVESHWSADGKTIFTSALITVRDVIKGKIDQKEIIVEYEGGKVGNKVLMVSDVSPLKNGEEIILFLTPGKSKKREQNGDVYNIVGRAQGKYILGDDGIARKSGFSLIDGKDIIDSNISVDILINKIKGIK